MKIYVNKKGQEVPVIKTGSGVSKHNRSQFDKINDLLLDKDNPCFELFNEETLFLDSTDGFISIVQSDEDCITKEEAELIADYLFKNILFDGETFIYIGDCYIEKTYYNANFFKKQNIENDYFYLEAE